MVVVEVPESPHIAGEQLPLTCRFSLSSTVDEGVLLQTEWTLPNDTVVTTPVSVSTTGSSVNEYYSVLLLDLVDSASQTGVYLCNVSVISISPYVVGSYTAAVGLVSISGKHMTTALCPCIRSIPY